MEREAIRRLMAGLQPGSRGATAIFTPRGLLRPQYRIASSEAPTLPHDPPCPSSVSTAGLVQERRSASSWSERSSSPVTKELGSPGFLQRVLPDSPSCEKHQQSPVARYFMDTQAMVRTLEDGGYTRQQAESVVRLLSNSLTANLKPLISSQITRRDMELLTVQFAGEIESVRSSLILLERSTVDSLRNDNEGLRAQIKKLHENLTEEMKRLEGGMQLEMNLEKGRLKEESSHLSQRIKDTHNRIDTEVAQLKTQIESQKLESIKYLAGGIFSVVTIVLSVMLGLSRLLM